MNAFVGRQFHPAHDDFLRRGTLVGYVLPYAQTLDLTGRLKGIVLSDSHHNRACNRPLICPILHGETSINEKWGIKIQLNKGIASYLRPDIASFISVPYGQVCPILRKDTRKECIFPEILTSRASERFIDIIRPKPEKFLQHSRGFLEYGAIGWSDSFPRITENKIDTAPVMNLTPPEIYAETGMALAVRGYSHVERYLPFRDVAIGSQRWFRTGFFSVSDICTLPIKGTLSKRSGWKAVHAGERALRGFERKEWGCQDKGIFEEILARYKQPQGCLPAHVTSSTSRRSPQGYRY